jgi:predicted phage terminase large subunit-like protein
MAAISADLLRARLVPRMTKYIPQVPTAKQQAFLLLDCQEAFFGGAAGGAKSSALLMAALQYVDVPGYSAIIFRRNYLDLTLPGALLDRAREWLGGTDARWDGQTYHFPSGAKLTFGYLRHEQDHHRYRSSELAFLGFDELTEFSEYQYRFLFSRLRRLKGVHIPLRVRSASNPGGRGHDWVRRRFVDPGSPSRPFIPSRIIDNPHLDQDEYRRSLSHLDSVTRAQLEHGDWSARTSGAYFRREWFEIVDAMPADCDVVRYWDLAASDPSESSDPDWTAGAKVGVSGDGIYYLADVERFRLRPHPRDQRIRSVAEEDGTAVMVYIEEEPGASGKSQTDHFIRTVLPGFAVRADRPTGDKLVRARPLSAQAEAGNVRLVRGPWLDEFLDEAEGFPDVGHDDQVDAASGAFGKLTHPGDYGITV